MEKNSQIKGLIKELLMEHNKLDLLYDRLQKNNNEYIKELPKKLKHHIKDYIKSENLPNNYEKSEDTLFIELKKQKKLKDFAEWLFNKIVNFEIYVDDNEYPLELFTNNDPKYLNTQWLIHVTDHPEKIQREGFKYGVSDLNKLGLTKYIENKDKIKGGYNFAYTIDDYKKYAYIGFGKYKYGSDIVLFRAPSIKIFHTLDNEYQCVFWGADAKNITSIINENRKFVIKNNAGKILYSTTSIEKLINLIISEKN